MPSICFFTSLTGDARNDNRARLPAAFTAAGWDVEVLDHRSLRIESGVVRAGARSFEHRDLLWLIGLGDRATFLDRMQLLATLDQRRFVTSPRALLEWHSKYQLVLGPFASFQPETHASCDQNWLIERISSGGKWIVKPAAGSYGREVYVVTRDDPNLRVILDSLTGHDGSRFCILQCFIDAAPNGEKRVLLVNGEPIGGYLRRATLDHRANLAADGAAEVTSLSDAETDLAERIGRHLAANGVRFAAIDLVYPYVIEFNIANPGGLATLARLSGVDPTRRVVDALGAYLRGLTTAPTGAA
jgi:glutathione synthase